MSKNVELVIKARDAATKAIDSIKEALADLTDVQSDVGRSAEKTDRLLGDLGRQLKTLDTEAKGLAALGKVSTELDRAGAAVSRLERNAEKGADEFNRLSRASQDAAAATTKLREQAEAEKQALDRATSAKRDARKELTAANRELREAERNQQRFNAAIAKTPETKQGSGQRSAGAFIQADLEAARARQVALAQSVEGYATAVNKSKAALTTLGPQIAAAATHEQKLAAETEKAGGALARQRGDLANARTLLSGMSTAADQASRSLLGTALDADKLAAASKRVSADLAQTETRVASMRRLGEVLGITTDGANRSAAAVENFRLAIVSTVAAFAGIAAIGSQIRGVVNAFQSLEGAQARLGVVFGGDTGKVGTELQFIGQQAQRLGVSFGVLSDQYSKFAVAANAANFSSEATREIFLSVAEAGRVNRLSTDQLNGVFLALTQMISKGKVSAEELRGQLGERLTGAFNIFADAIGVSTAELDKMLEKGEVFATQSTLLKFADQLSKRFGPELAKALEGTTAEIGRFQDNIYQAQVRVGQGGFIEAFTAGLRGLNEQFQSREGRDFFLSLGAALGKLTSALSVAPRYFDEIGLAIKVLIGIKVGSYFGGIVRSIAEMRTAIIGIGGTATAAAGAFRLLWSAVGGVPGLIFSGITVALGSWVGKIDETVSALDEHKRQMDLILGQIDAARTKTGAWAGDIRGLTITEVESSIRNLTSAYASQFDTLRDKASGVLAIIERFQGPLGALNRQGAVSALGESTVRNFEDIAKAIDQVGKRQITIQQFKETLDGIAQTATDSDVKALAADLIEAAKATSEHGETLEALGTAIGQAEAALKGLRGEADASTEAVLRGSDAAAQTGEAMRKAASEGAKEFQDKLREIKELVPAVGDELKRLADIDALNRLYQDAVKVARTMGDVMNATKAYNDALDGINLKAFGGGNDPGMRSAVQQIKGYEGFRAEPYYDVNHFRVGYGSHTVTLADGSIQKVVQGIAITEADAMRDLVRRVGEFSEGAKKQIGSDRFGAFSADQQGVLTSIAYNYGSLPERIVDAIKTGNADTIAKAIRGLGSDNGGINRGRREKEANTFAVGGDTPKSAAILADADKKRSEYQGELKNRLSLQAQEIANGGRLTQEAFVQKQLAEEQNRAREAGVTLTDQQITAIKQQAAEEYNIANAKREGKTAQQEANVALQQAVALAAQRNELQKQFDVAQRGGDLTKATELQGQLEGTNTKLGEAIEKARAMWMAIGGPEADVALTKLDTLQLKAERSGNRLSLFGLSFQDLQGAAQNFAGGVADSFGSFAQAIANGQNAVKAFGTAFAQMAAQVLQDLAKIAIKKAILGLIGGATGMPVALAHTGGVVGSVGAGLGNGRRTISPEIIANAMRFHTGGLPGLGPDEIPIIAKANEEILTKEDPRHRANGGLRDVQGAADPSYAFKHVLVMDEESATKHIAGSAGEKVIMTHIKNNSATIKRMLG